MKCKIRLSYTVSFLQMLPSLHMVLQVTVLSQRICECLEHVLVGRAQIGEDTPIDGNRELDVGKHNMLSMLASQ
jgi:hypothetical protein